MNTDALELGGEKTMILLGFLALLVPAVLFRLVSRSRRRWPPGPQTLPLIGNLLSFPTEREWLTFAKWQDVYGDLVYLTVLGQPILVVNSLKVAFDLLEKKSSIYSSRPHLVMAGDLVGFDQAMELMPYTDRFRQLRRLITKELSGNALRKYWPMHEEESRALIRNIASDPRSLFASIRHYSGSVILKVTYGYQTAPSDDPFLVLAKQVMAAFSRASQPGAWMVDLIPWLQHVPDWMPGTGFKQTAHEFAKLHMAVIEGPYEWAEKHQDSPLITKPNFVSTVLSEKDGILTAEERDTLLWSSASLFGGGADTTVSALSSFFLAMSLHPEIQRRGQDELDRTLGGKRLPSLTDRPLLPYIEAIMREVLRLYTVTPLAIPHMLTEDDQYEGYDIPRGTIVMPNVWNILHDHEIFSDPENFRPEQFIGDEQALKVANVIFGFGRRACLGVNFAESSMFIAIATALATCTFSNASDNGGAPIPKDVQLKTGTISHPPEFSCTIQYRSDRARALLSL